MMRSLAIALLGSAAGEAAASPPPPPPPPLAGEAPAEIGGYPTDAMNAVYQYWLRRQVADAGRIALEKGAPKPYPEAEGERHFELRSGPSVSASTVWGDTADHWAFSFICPRAPDAPSARGPATAFLAYLDEVKDRCVWQASRALARYSTLEQKVGRASLRPDFARFAARLREAGVAKVSDGDIPAKVFAGLGDVTPLLAQAVEVATVTAADCPALPKVLEELEGQELKLDMEKVGTDRTSVTPHHHPSLFEARLPVVHGGNGHGKIELTDYGSGAAYESWRKVNDGLSACFRPGGA